jgi:hypothetical protein
MKIAILFSGRISFFQKSYPNIMENIVQGNEVDFFISYPKDPDINEMNSFLERFEPKAFMESDEEYFNIDRFPPPKKFWVKSRPNMMYMFLNRKNVCEIFKKYIEENNIFYDLVISTRIDFILYSKLNLNQLLQKSNENFLCIPSGNDWAGGLNDRIAIGNLKIMIEYMLCYNSLEYLFEKGTYVHPENALKDYVDYKKMKVFRFPLKTDVIRK